MSFFISTSRRDSAASMAVCLFVWVALLSSAAAQQTEREETNNTCVIHLIGKPSSSNNKSQEGHFRRVTFRCTGSSLPVPIRVHPAVLDAASVQEGVFLTTDDDVRGLIQFEDVLSLTVLDSVFEGLIGGGLAPVVFDRSAGLFYNCRFAENAFARSGGIFAAGSSLMHVYDSVFQNNRGESYGAVSTTNGCETLFRNTKFLNNHGGMHDTSAEGFVSGAVFSFQSTVTKFEGCEFEHNVAAGAGAGAFTGLKRAIVTFTDCTIEGNSGDSGAMSLTDTCSGTLNNTRIIQNHGTAEGAAISLHIGSDLGIDDCKLMQNHGVSGAVVVHDSSDLNIADSTFEDNAGFSYGGAVSSLFGGQVTIQRCEFQSNSGSFGGAIYQDRVQEAVFEHCVFIGNLAHHTGGAIFQKDVNNTEITNCQFRDNEGGAVGGALTQTGCGDVDWLTGDPRDLLECRKDASPACQTIEISDSTFDGNSAIQGSSLFQHRCKNVVVTSTSFPDEEKTVVQQRCVERVFESSTPKSDATVSLESCPAKPKPDRKLLLADDELLL